jgi:cytoskeleton protein RodZ
MAEQVNAEAPEAPLDKEKLGAYLKRAREAARVDISTLAREKRLSREYIEAIEASRWEVLPGPTYCRAYLSSLAQQLRLDRNKILQWYSEEVGLDLARDHAEQLEFKAESEEVVTKPGPRPSILVVVLVFAMIIFAVKTFKDEELPDGAKEFLPAALKDSAAVAVDSSSTSDSLLLESIADSTIGKASSAALSSVAAGSAAKGSSAKVASSAGSVAAESAKSVAVTGVPSRLQINCPSDSGWIQIQSRGTPDWAIWIRAGGTRYVQTRSDTMVVRMGDFTKLDLELNFQPIAPGRNQFKIFNGRVLP